MKREWIVHPNPETGEIDPGALEQVAADAATVARMVGGVVQIGPKRVQDNGEWFTVAALVEWSSFAPSERERQPDPGEGEGEDEAPLVPMGVGADDES